MGKIQSHEIRAMREVLDFRDQVIVQEQRNQELLVL